MTRIIKGFAIDWGDRWRRTVWAQLTGTALSSTGSTFTSTSTTTCSICTPPTSTSTSSSFSSSTGTQSLSDTLARRWLVSSLAKGGLLIDAYDLVYVIGGWTYAGFETPQNNARFGLHGGTIGAGVERQISPLWGIKVEYRSTKFQSKTVDLPVTSSTTTVSPTNNSGGTTSGGTSTFATFTNNAARFSADMQTVWVGVSRYFGTY